MQAIEDAEVTVAARDKPIPSESSKEGTDEISTIYLPRKFSKCSRTDLAVLISRMLTFLIQINDSLALSKPENARGLTRFHSRVPPGISVYNYLIRLTKYSSLEHCVLLTAVYYIDLLSSVYPVFTLSSLTVHRFLLTATTVASKGLCDSFCTNTHYAKVGGVHSSELNILECEFLKRVNYRILPRDDNIDWCKLETKLQKFTLYEEPEMGQNSRPQNSLKNSGYNVLDAYFRKIVQLVGSYASSPDKSKVVNYVLRPSSPIKDGSRDSTHDHALSSQTSLESISTRTINSDSKPKSHEDEEPSARKRNLDSEAHPNGKDKVPSPGESKLKKMTNNQRTPNINHHSYS
ncbi:Pho80p TDEL_0G04430 [Torulaspora delbrueckii]|uniref:Cyclin n=1 Tax=Torulaspora delbrueckii TaxID=4950 RepID=G8ZY43_TORDE|nr:hypothetical protein TDEL_0G04430 [Torulaspora delbrueckii]CCE93810.1 hypothetical protein TDEL_0G04430 [Torulaspora delbrueckii]